MKKKGFNGNGILLFLLVILMIVLIVFCVVLVYTYFSIDFLNKTEPKEVFRYTSGDFVINDSSFMDFDDFLVMVKGLDNDSYDSDYFYDEPLVEDEPLFDDSRKKYFDRCSRKKININFSSSVYSSFSFNYLNESFFYNISLYEDLFNFSSRLKSEDCYFRQGSYAEGFLSDPYNNYFLKAISNDFIGLIDRGYSRNEVLEIASIFVQSIRYGTDESGLNKYPYQTIYDEEGNCLDKSVILAGILGELGFNVYIILGYVDEYHGLVGVECENGNIIYGDKNICFIETTIFTPIGTDVKIEIDKVINVFNGSEIYVEEHYGFDKLRFFESRNSNVEFLVSMINEVVFVLSEIQNEMCETDCVICEGGEVNFKRSRDEISSCYDAKRYNRLVEEYNQKIADHNSFVNEVYFSYYEMEKSMFGNVEVLKRL